MPSNSCYECKHHQEHKAGVFQSVIVHNCRALLDPVTGRPSTTNCYQQRAADGPCHNAKLFEPKEQA
jgi:hypothetical protein